MDDAKNVLLSILMSFAFIGAVAHTAQIEYIGPEKQHELEETFAKSTYSPAKNDKSLSKSKWSCDMYGVRTRLQVQRGLSLYEFMPQEQLNGWHNNGAQVVSEYKSETGALVGVSERFEDQIKMTAHGQLISQLSVLTPQKVVVAYSLCTNL